MNQHKQKAVRAEFIRSVIMWKQYRTLFGVWKQYCTLFGVEIKADSRAKDALTDTPRFTGALIIDDAGQYYRETILQRRLHEADLAMIGDRNDNY